MAAEGLNPAAPDCWPFNVLTPDLSRAGRLAAIQTGPYGRCVYRCDNDVVDHQSVLMELANGVSVNLIMHGHSDREHRSMRYDGTRATLRARTLDEGDIEINYHGGKSERIAVDAASGHGGGDEGIMADFVRVLRGEIPPLTTARVALESHLLAFAAEDARLSGQVVEMEEYRAAAEGVRG
jgi:hypothetical protein